MQGYKLPQRRPRPGRGLQPRAQSPPEIIQFYGAPAAAVPASPGPVTATANSPTQVTLTFADVTNEAGYSVLPAPAAGRAVHRRRRRRRPIRRAFVDQGLTQSTQYFYQVVAFNQAGASAPATAYVDHALARPRPGHRLQLQRERRHDRVEDVSPENADNDGTLAGDTPPDVPDRQPQPRRRVVPPFRRATGCSRAPAGAWTPTSCSPDPRRHRQHQLLHPHHADRRRRRLGVARRHRRRGGGRPERHPLGDLAPEGEVRAQAFYTAVSSTPTPINTGEWFRVTHTRDATSGVLRTYVNGVLVSAGGRGRRAGAGRLPRHRRHHRRRRRRDDDRGVQLPQRRPRPDRDLRPGADGRRKSARRYGPAATAAPASPGPRDRRGGRRPRRSRSTSPTSPTKPATPILPLHHRRRAVHGDRDFARRPDQLRRLRAHAGDAVLLPGGRVQPGRQFAPAAASVTTANPLRNPVIVYTFDEGTGETVANTGIGRRDLRRDARRRPAADLPDRRRQPRRRRLHALRRGGTGAGLAPTFNNTGRARRLGRAAQPGPGRTRPP